MKVTDLLPYGKLSNTHISYGGPGERYVGLEIKSAKGVGIHSRVEICAFSIGPKKSREGQEKNTEHKANIFE